MTASLLSTLVGRELVPDVFKLPKHSPRHKREGFFNISHGYQLCNKIEWYLN